uniref:Uncharacterized protein n=1 Tax=Arundo donax TaxID=35708 RepID=A0A0A9FJE7_ARUDO
MKYVVKNQYNGIHSLGYIYICYPSTSLKGVFFFQYYCIEQELQK